MSARPEWAAWLRLTQTPGLSPGAVRRLLAAFGSPAAVLEASPAALHEVGGTEVAAALAAPIDGIETLLDATARWLATAPADAPRHLVTLADPHYPPALLEAADPPLLLHAIGRLALLRAPSVAIVGSRRATPQGLDNARAFARHLSERGLTIVSGLASGIDGAAHEGALAGPGSTIAVVGTGLDQIYPQRHQRLGERICREGLMLSELPLGAEPLSFHFPRRNRIIAGLARGTLVVEAALASGSLITARAAVEAGREVFAIPGSIHSPQSRGCHHLIRQGAKLVETGDDILEELGAGTRTLDFGPTDRPPAAVPAEQQLLDVMGYDPVTLDALSARTGLDAAALGARLLSLELAGRVGRLPGGLVQRRATA